MLVVTESEVQGLRAMADGQQLFSQFATCSAVLDFLVVQSEVWLPLQVDCQSLYCSQLKGFSHFRVFWLSHQT